MTIYQQQVELDTAFRVDSQGGIAVTSDPSRVLRNHIFTIIGTQVGERVMRPTYGADVLGMLFENDDDLSLSLLSGDIRTALTSLEPGLVVHGVLTEASDDDDGTIVLNVTYSAANKVETISIPVNTAVLYRGGAVEEERSG